MAPVLVPLRPSSEHILIVRAPGAREQHGCHSLLLIVRVPRARRMGWLLPFPLYRPDSDRYDPPKIGARADTSFFL